MSTNTYKLIKVTPNEIMFDIHPISNPTVVRRIHLTDRNSQYALPEDYALGIFMDGDVLTMYRKGYFTFDKNEELAKAAYEAGCYFGEALDFEPAKPNRSEEILTVLKSGNRRSIEEAIQQYTAEEVRDIAIVNAGQLTQNVISMLENILKIQLIPDGE